MKHNIILVILTIYALPPKGYVLEPEVQYIDHI